MKIDVDETRSILNDLIETNKDADQGFRDSAEKLKDPEIRTLFLNFSRERAHFAGELQQEVTRLGGEPATSGSTAGALHRGWIGLKAALTGDNEHSILEEAERGEDAAVKNYREALAKNLPADLHAIVSQQYRSIQQAHNRVRDLRDRSKTETPTPVTGVV
jgi:uncharacterized protein (TIGR02284 family)